MKYFRNIVIIALMLCVIVVSGCMDENTTEEGNTSPDVADPGTEQEISVADMALNEGMAGVTDSEIQDLEAQLAELEALIDEMNLEEDIVPEEI
ncbi:hypothetical protein [Methanolobus sp. WCC5]|jgi:outer membrane murein-binding lipoprotein Lpp|uniref:hypothetical protein n=1 Tax=Methanolobus sp. WCC5 TaxID=3125785 RepID=UPI0032445AB7